MTDRYGMNMVAKQFGIPTRAVIVAIVLAVSALVWYQGLQTSPILIERTGREHTIRDGGVQETTPASRLETELATAYWHRYPDVKKDPLYGTAGPLGIYGPREHFQLHGKREGRIWGPAPDRSKDNQ